MGKMMIHCQRFSEESKLNLEKIYTLATAGLLRCAFFSQEMVRPTIRGLGAGLHLGGIAPSVRLLTYVHGDLSCLGQGRAPWHSSENGVLLDNAASVTCWAYSP